MKSRTYILFLIAIFFLATADTIIFHPSSWIVACNWIKLDITNAWFLSDGWHFSKTMAIVFFILAIISESIRWDEIFCKFHGREIKLWLALVFYFIFLLISYTILHIFLFNFLFNNFQFNINP